MTIYTDKEMPAAKALSYMTKDWIGGDNYCQQTLVDVIEYAKNLQDELTGKEKMPLTEMSFGYAIEALKKGLKVSRKGWNGKGMFLFMGPEDDLPISILLGAKSLPKGVKDYYEAKHQPIIPGEEPKIKFTGYICMKAADDTIVNGWLASQTDILADDWEIID